MAAGLEQLDAYGSIDDLPFSLDDPVWDLLFPALIPDKCGPLSLEDLDDFGSIDSLNYSLDDPIWLTACKKFGQAVANSSAQITVNANATFSGLSSVDASASVDATGLRILAGAGDIAANATVSAAGTAIFAGNAAINASATVSADGYRIRNSSGSIFAYADVSAYANATWSSAAAVNASASADATAVRIRTSTADVSATADVSSGSLRIRTSNADIQGTASVTALGGVLYSGRANVDAIATVTLRANATFSGSGAVNAGADVTVDGTRLGDNWSSATPGSGSYTPVAPPPFNPWGLIPPAIGEAFQGGFYAGEYTLNNQRFFLIVGDKSLERQASNPMSNVANFRLYVSDTDGLSATNWIAFPTLVQSRPNTGSFYFQIRQSNISGTTDWYYPSRAELQVIMSNLYPTTTAAPLFRTGGAQAFGTSNPTGYWTSSIRPIYTYPTGNRWYLWSYETQLNGGMFSPELPPGFSTFLFNFRPIRRVLAS